MYQEGRTGAFTLRAEQNFYYYTVHEAIKECWAAFPQSADEVIGGRERYWTALRYTWPWTTSTTLALTDTKSRQAVTLEEKEEMIRNTTFPQEPADPGDPPPHLSGRAFRRVNEAIVQRLLFHQSQKKAGGPDRLNFSTLHLL